MDSISPTEFSSVPVFDTSNGTTIYMFGIDAADAIKRNPARYIQIPPAGIQGFANAFANPKPIIGSGTVTINIPTSQSGAQLGILPDMTQLIQQAMDATPYGGTLIIPGGQYRLIGSGTQILNRTTPIKMVGVGFPVFNVDSSVPNTRDIIRWAPSAPDMVGFQLSGLTVLGGKGRHCLYIDCSGGPSGGWIEQGLIADNTLVATAAGQSIFLNNNTTAGGLAYTTIQRNILDSISLGNCGDNDTIESNTIDARGSTNEGIFAYNAAGGANLKILKNVIAGANTLLDFEAGVSTVIRDNEFEANVVNSSTFMVALSTGGGSNYAPQLLNNSLVGLAGSGITIGILILTGTAGTLIEGGRIDVPTGGTHIVVNSGATGTRINDWSIQFSTNTVNGASNILDSASVGQTYRAAPLWVQPCLVSALPAATAALKGARGIVTDATAPAFLGTLTGGAAVVCPVVCNGVAWVPG